MRPPHTRLVRMPRSAEYSPAQMTRIREPEDVVRMLRPIAEQETVECVWVIALDEKSKVLAYTELSRGLVNSALVRPREVYRWALFNDASGVILVHNHPSGDPMPSAEDRAVTRAVQDAGRLLEVPLYDHVIVAGDRWTSFAVAGLL